ncbi:fimbrial protein [Escherichia coli]|uniref:fimbrial protein n=2 Tax=Escherichia coli TaxID=562 RepID=UPI000BB5BAE4|nr:fimbrial protein [Escherichia coli]EFB5169055.1 fimbrial protein [Escherichia coli]EHT8279559.1 fimbrial protein [Escherichia coli]PBR57875.1 fimbrial protein [Escherichia coli]HAG5912118.1 fimbrial protein [Escherichia coli]HAM9850244.1 fimbrial protein [Escherichia coli]
MKKTLLAAAMIFASSSVMAADGGQIDFNGLVQSGTCKVGVADGGKQSITSDGVVTLNTANVTDTFPEVSETSVGLLPKEFKISVDCAPASNGNASLTMSSISFANTSGTLNNNMNVTVNGLSPAENVNIAVHNMTNQDGAPEIKQVHMNDASNVQSLKLDAQGDGQYLFNASYVKAPSSSAVTAGHVTTNAMYTIIYN